MNSISVDCIDVQVLKNEYITCGDAPYKTHGMMCHMAWHVIYVCMECSIYFDFFPLKTLGPSVTLLFTKVDRS